MREEGRGTPRRRPGTPRLVQVGLLLVVLAGPLAGPVGAVDSPPRREAPVGEATVKRADSKHRAAQQPTQTGRRVAARTDGDIKPPPARQGDTPRDAGDDRPRSAREGRVEAPPGTGHGPRKARPGEAGGGSGQGASGPATMPARQGAPPTGAVLTAATVGAATASPPTGPASVRVLIDTSGSMRENDPHNLRVAGLRLLTGLLAPEIDAGVWLFGARTEQLVRPAAADAAWKERARLLASRIHSRDARTDIEQALEAVTNDWRSAPASGPRSVLLLTDGVVDVSTDAAKSQASRERILGPLADALGAAGIQVHSVALSKAADHALLEALARRTGGRSLDVSQAEELDRGFLHLLEGSAPRDGLPLADGRILVDASVSELTLLVFRSEKGPPLTLTSPSGETLRPPGLPKNVRWAREPAWDMVTIRQPEAGEWRLPPGSDPDDRALIVSDLSLAVAPLPGRPETGSELPLEVRLLEGGQPIERADFLELVQAQATLDAAGGAKTRLALSREGGAPGYSGRLALGDRPGEAALIIEVEGHTFRRQRRLPVTIASPPLTAEFAGLGSDADAFRLFLEPVGAAAREGKVELRVQAPDGSHQTLLARLEQGAALLTIPRPAPGDYHLEARVRGVDSEGLPFEQRLGPWQLHALAPLPAVTPQPVVAPPPAFDPNAPLATDWRRVAWQVGLVNLLAALLGLAVHRHLARHSRAASRAWAHRIEAAMA